MVFCTRAAPGAFLCVLAGQCMFSSGSVQGMPPVAWLWSRYVSSSPALATPRLHWPDTGDGISPPMSRRDAAVTFSL